MDLSLNSMLKDELMTGSYPAALVRPKDVLDSKKVERQRMIDELKQKVISGTYNANGREIIEGFLNHMGADSFDTDRGG